MTVIPMPSWEPDKGRLNAAAATSIINAIPTEDGYRPFPGISLSAATIPATPKGSIVARNSNGANIVFVATSTAIYRLNSDMTWIDVSKVGGYSLADGDFWSTAVFGENVIFTHVNDPPQSYNLDTSTDFADIGGGAPQARYVTVSGDYLLLLSTDVYPSRFYRSGINDINFWTPKKRGSDFQDLPDGGWITGATGFDTGALIFSESNIRILTDLPGSPLLFSLAKSEVARGVVAPRSIVQVGNTTFYLAQDGFKQFSAPESAPIGVGKIDQTFLSELLDAGQIAQVQGVADPINKMVIWLYPSTSGQNTAVGYHYDSGKWVNLILPSVFLLNMSTPGVTLEELSTVLGYTSLEDVPSSLDSREWVGGAPVLGGFTNDNTLGFYSGLPSEATFEFSDVPLGGENRRGFVTGFRPIGLTGAYGQIGTKETLSESETIVWSEERPQNSLGIIPTRVSGRTLRAKLRIPEGTAWKRIVGLEMPSENMRRAGRR